MTDEQQKEQESSEKEKIIATVLPETKIAMGAILQYRYEQTGVKTSQGEVITEWIDRETTFINAEKSRV